MKKILFLALTVLFAQTTLASGLWFGADTASYEKNEFCNYDLKVPVIKARGEGEVPVGILKLNLEWQQDMTAAISDFNKNTNVSDEPEMCKSFGYGYQVSYDFNIKTSLASPVTSIEMNYYWYTGGAHGNSGSAAVTFVTATGEKVTSLADFLNESGLADFKTLVEERLLAQEVDPTFGWNGVKEQWSSMKDIKNFHIGLKGQVVISFDPYEVGPYAQGPVSVEVYPWQLTDKVGYNNSEVSKLIQTIGGVSAE